MYFRTQLKIKENNILEKDVITKRKFEIKAKKNWPIFWCSLTQAVEEEILGFFITKHSSL